MQKNSGTDNDNDIVPEKPQQHVTEWQKISYIFGFNVYVRWKPLDFNMTKSSLFHWESKTKIKNGM